MSFSGLMFLFCFVFTVSLVLLQQHLLRIPSALAAAPSVTVPAVPGPMGHVLA